jgi:hypothetical protein
MEAQIACLTQTPDAVNEDIWASSTTIHGQPSFDEELLARDGDHFEKLCRWSITEAASPSLISFAAVSSCAQPRKQGDGRTKMFIPACSTTAPYTHFSVM